MLNILAIICPPLAVLAAGSSPSTVVANVGLTLLGYVPGMLHARAIVEKHIIEQRYNTVMVALERRRQLA